MGEIEKVSSVREVLRRYTLSRLIAAGVVVVLAAIMAGCRDDRGEASVVLLHLPREKGDITAVTWLPGGSIYLLLQAGSGPRQLASVTSASSVSILSISPTTSCDDPILLDLTVLPNGQLGGISECNPQSPRAAVTIKGNSFEKLASLPAGTLIEWNPGIRDGWIEYLADGCRSIARFVEGKVERFPDYYPRELMPWAADRDFFADGTCIDPGRTGFATPSPSGGFYFLASPRARGNLSNDAEWNLLALNPDTGRLNQLGDDFRNPTDLDVTPDGSALVISATWKNSESVWQIDTATGQIHRLTQDGKYGVVAPSPDSRHVAVVRGARLGDELLKLPLRKAV